MSVSTRRSWLKVTHIDGKIKANVALLQSLSLLFKMMKKQHLLITLLSEMILTASVVVLVHVRQAISKIGHLHHLYTSHTVGALHIAQVGSDRRTRSSINRSCLSWVLLFHPSSSVFLYHGGMKHWAMIHIRINLLYRQLPVRIGRWYFANGTALRLHQELTDVQTCQDGRSKFPTSCLTYPWTQWLQHPNHRL